VLRNILVEFGFRRPDVMESLRPFQAILPTELAIRGNTSTGFRIVVHHNMLEVLAVGSVVVVAEEG